MFNALVYVLKQYSRHSPSNIPWKRKKETQDIFNATAAQPLITYNKKFKIYFEIIIKSFFNFFFLLNINLLH